AQVELAQRLRQARRLGAGAAQLGLAHRQASLALLHRRLALAVRPRARFGLCLTQRRLVAQLRGIDAQLRNPLQLLGDGLLQALRALALLLALDAQALQRRARIAQAILGLRRRDLARGQLRDHAVDLIGQRQRARAQLAGAPLGLVDTVAVGLQRLRRVLVAALALAARPIQIRRLRAQLAAARPEPAQLVGRAIEILLLGDDAHLVGAHRRAQLLERAPDLDNLLLGRNVPGQRRLVVCVEPRDDLLQLTDLALLLQHAHRRLARAAADHAVRIDDFAF